MHSNLPDIVQKTLSSAGIIGDDLTYWAGFSLLGSHERQEFFSFFETASKEEIRRMHNAIKEKTDLLQSEKYDVFDSLIHREQKEIQDL